MYFHPHLLCPRGSGCFREGRVNLKKWTNLLQVLFSSSFPCAILTGFPDFRIHQIQPLPDVRHLLRAVSGYKLAYLSLPDREFFLQVAIRSAPPMPKATPVLHLVLSRIH